MTQQYKTLYHISRDFEENIETFIPRIPTRRAGDEDKTILRICTSDTLEGCMIAHPNLWYHMYEYPEADYACPYEMMDRIVTLLDYEAEQGFLVKIYEFQVEKEHVMFPQELKEKGLLPDVDFTNEHWIIKETKPHQVYYAFIRTASLENKKQKFDYMICQKEELGRVANGWYYYHNEEDKRMIIL